MRTMLITGATGGVGRKLVERYDDQHKYLVMGCGKRIGSDYCCDIRNSSSVQEMFREVGQVDILINVAGVASMNSLLLAPVRTIADIVDINLTGTIFMCQEAGKMMMAQGYGRIINISTVAVPLALAGEAVYVASKAGVEALTRVLAKELYGYGITVNCVAPTIVDVGGLASGVPEEKVRELLEKTATKEPCNIEDIAKVIDFFIDSPRVTGQTVYIGGV